MATQDCYTNVSIHEKCKNKNLILKQPSLQKVQTSKKCFTGPAPDQI
jgi:hypothetical protein